MRHVTPWLVLVATLIGCELNQGSGDVQASADDDVAEASDEVSDPKSPFEPEPEPEVPDGPPVAATGCEWAAGLWRFIDCQTPDGIDLQFAMTGCTVQVVASTPGLAGSFGQVYDGGLTLQIPNAATTCHGFYDGSYLTGACSAPSTAPCWFVAQKQ